MKLYNTMTPDEQEAFNAHLNERERRSGAAGSSARSWKCDMGNGEWDHDWQERHDDAGEVDGIPGDHWSWRECRVCGAIEGEAPNEKVSDGH